MVHHCKYPLFWSNQSICKVWSCYIQQSRRRCIYKKVHYFTFYLDQGQTRNIAQYPLNHMTYAPVKFEVAMSNGLGANAFTRNFWFDLDPESRSHAGSRSHEALPSKSCALCTCKVWSCYVQWLRRCIYKKIHHLTLNPRSRGSWSHEMLPSALDIMWPMHQQSLILLHPMVKVKMHLQENTLYDLDLGIKVTKNVAQYPRHHVPYAPAKFDVATSHG